MNRLKRLEPIRELAERREKQAVQTFGHCQQKLEVARNGLNNLRAFRENYSSQFHQMGHRGLGVQRLQEYRAFLEKINKAIAEQEKVLQRAERELEAAKRAWEEAHGHVLGMQTLVDKLRTETARQEQKREQDENDDRASRRASTTLLSIL